MTSKIAVYKSHEKALEAVNDLKKSGFPINQISLLGEAQIIDDHMHLKSLEPAKTMPIAIGAMAGIVVGLLSGIGIFAIPGFGFLYGAGAIIGAMGGLDLGIISGGLAVVLTNIGVEEDEVIKYEEHIKAGRFVVIANGTKEEINKAGEILGSKNTAIQLS